MKIPRPSKFQISLFFNGILLLVFVLLIGNWLKNNTATFTSSLDQQQIEINNDNAQETANFTLKNVEIAGRTLNIPEGFMLEEYVSGLDSARFLSFSDDGTLYVGTKSNDKVFAVSDTNGDGIGDGTAIVDEGLIVPHSVKYFNGDLYVAEETRVTVYRDIRSDGSYTDKQVLIDGLPSGNQLTGGGHKTRTVDIGPDKKIYLTIGSSCNVCIEDDERRATMMRFDLDGTNGEIIATGLRNTVGFDFADDGAIWSTDMGRDRIGDDIPSEEVNIIKPGNDYGWPYCWGDGFFNPEFAERSEFCRNNTTFPVYNMQAHSAPLATIFMNEAAKQTWPKGMRNGLLVAFHGSWNRTVPTGYKVVYLDLSGDQIKQYNLVSGWLDESAEAWGRPAGLAFDNEGNLYISDDKRGVIYKMSYQPL